jgi:hypothetical protein
MKIYNKITGFTEIVEYPGFKAGRCKIILCEKILESNRIRAWVKIRIPL